VSDDVANSVDHDRLALESIGPVTLKGVARPVPLHAVERKHADGG
jgi:class 3 adenylate cyclase